MKLITVIVGHTFDQYGKLIPVDSVNAAKTAIVEYASQKFGGVIIFDTFGGWMDGNGQTVKESGWTIQVLTNNSEAAEVFAHYVKGLLNQNSVVFIVETVDSRFI